MAKDQPPSFQWYPRDFAASCVGMTDRQELAYRRALDQSWIQCCWGVGSESEWKRWSRLSDAEWAEDRDAIADRCVIAPDGTWVQLRMVRTLMERELFSRLKSDAGRVGAIRRWNGRGMAVPSSKRIANDSTASASASAVKTDSKDAAAAALVLVSKTASGMSLKPLPDGRWKVDPAEAWELAKNLPPPRNKTAMELVGRIARQGGSQFFATCALAHYVQNHDRVENAFAYYNPRGEKGQMMLADWSRRAMIDEHRAEEALNKAWLAGQRQ